MCNCDGEYLLSYRERGRIAKDASQQALRERNAGYGTGIDSLGYQQGRDMAHQEYDPFIREWTQVYANAYYGTLRELDKESVLRAKYGVEEEDEDE